MQNREFVYLYMIKSIGENQVSNLRVNSGLLVMPIIFSNLIKSVSISYQSSDAGMQPGEGVLGVITLALLSKRRKGIFCSAFSI